MANVPSGAIPRSAGCFKKKKIDACLGSVIDIALTRAVCTSVSPASSYHLELCLDIHIPGTPLGSLLLAYQIPQVLSQGSVSIHGDERISSGESEQLLTILG